MFKYFFTAVTAGTLLMTAVMNITGKPLKTPATPAGILNLEFAYNSNIAQEIITAWQPGNKIAAAEKNTWFDFVFILFYSIFLHFACKMLAKKYTGNMQRAGIFLSLCAIAAGLLDVVENIGMLITLQGHISNAVTVCTVIVSSVKWLLAACCLLYCLVAGAGSMLKKPSHTL